MLWLKEGGSHIFSMQLRTIHYSVLSHKILNDILLLLSCTPYASLSPCIYQAQTRICRVLALCREHKSLHLPLRRQREAVTVSQQESGVGALLSCLGFRGREASGESCGMNLGLKPQCWFSTFSCSSVSLRSAALDFEHPTGFPHSVE